MKNNALNKHTILVIVVFIVTLSTYLILTSNNGKNISQNKSSNSKREEDSYFNTEWGVIDGCVNVKFNERSTKGDAILLLQTNSINVPKYLLEQSKPNGLFIPTFEVRAPSLEKAESDKYLLTQNPNISEVTIINTSVHPDSYGVTYSRVLFKDNITLSEARELLNNKYHIQINGTGVKSTHVRLDVNPGQELKVIELLQNSSIVDRVAQCGKMGPVLPL